MLGTEIFKGAGLGNQLFFYVTTRCIAKDLGYDFGLINPENFANNIHSDCGLYILSLLLVLIEVFINAFTHAIAV